MTAITMDTLKYADLLEASGFTRIQAKQLTEILNEREETILHDIREHDDSLATKHDLFEVEKVLKSDVKGLEKSLRSDMSGLEKSLRSDMNGLGSSLRSEMHQLESRILYKMCGMLASVVIAIAALIKF